MASNPNVNKVVYGNVAVLDLTSDTVEADKLLQGYTAHDKSGAIINGAYVAPTINNITPSNTSPASMSTNNNYKPTANGYAISSYSNVTPSNSSPATLTSGNINKMSGSGYAIQSYSNVTPTTSGTYFSSGFKKMSSSGYAYSSQQGSSNLKQGTITISSYSTGANVTVAFKPRWICFEATTTSSAKGWFTKECEALLSTRYCISYWASASISSFNDYATVTQNGSSYTVNFTLYGSNWNGSTVNYTIVGE